jgi:LPXTG-motif cell wall-anchored protein
MDGQVHSRRVRLFAIFTVMFVGASILGLFASPAFAQPGDTKLLLPGSVTEVDYNSPHLPGCSFDIEWTGFPANTQITYSFSSQSPTTGGTFINGTANTDNNGLAKASVSFTPVNLANVVPHSAQGYHVTLLGDLGDQGASLKKKTFWVELSCGGPAPVDLCPNIQGDQDPVPPGMHVDANGNCVADPVDLCPNIQGDQDPVPPGMHVDANGNCVDDPVDVCPNIQGDQDQVPPGMHVDANGNCVDDPDPVAHDACPNIAGNQAAVPNGMHKNGSGDCVKPKDVVLGESTHNAKPQKKPIVKPDVVAADADNELPFTGVNDQAPYTALGGLLLLSGLGFLYLHRKSEQLEL